MLGILLQIAGIGIFDTCVVSTLCDCRLHDVSALCQPLTSHVGLALGQSVLAHVAPALCDFSRYPRMSGEPYKLGISVTPASAATMPPRTRSQTQNKMDSNDWRM